MASETNTLAARTSAPRSVAPTKIGAREAEQRAIRELCAPKLVVPVKKEVPTFNEWFKGRFWEEWVVSRKNKPSEVRSKNIIFDLHLKPRFGDVPLDGITTSEVARFRAFLVGKKLSDKRINNILAVLSKPLKYAVDCEVIEKGPKVGMFKVEEIVAWNLGFQRTRHGPAVLADVDRGGRDVASPILPGDAEP